MDFIFVVNLLLLTTNYHNVQGRLTRGDLEIEEQQKILNKPFIKSIQDESGVLDDCIETLKQPAFDHPLLKDHKIQLKPSWITNDEVPSQDNIFGMIFNNLKCPEGTVPIRRSPKEELIRTKLSTSTHLFGENDLAPANVAIVRAENSGQPRIYFGVEAGMNIINPTVADDQASFTFIGIGNGNDGTYDQIDAGWGVNPMVYGDHKTHLTATWRNSRANKGCYDVLCPGFVQVSNIVPLGGVLPNVTKYDADIQYMVQLRISLDKATKNWWLTCIKPGIEMQIGYWPATLFSDLTDAASNVFFGGVAVSYVNKARPPMGFGTFPEKNYRHCGYFAFMKVTDKNNQTTGLFGNWKQYTNCPDHYGVSYYGKRGENGYTMEYGGPGGMCGA